MKIPIKILLEYREFDRINKLAPCIPFVQQYTVNDVIKWIQSGNIPNPIELSIINNTALITDGNHRIAALYLLYGKNYMININVNHIKNNPSDIFYDHTLNKFRPLDKNLIKYINGDFKKS